jgi:hypothetical protein
VKAALQLLILDAIHKNLGNDINELDLSCEKSSGLRLDFVAGGI